MSGKNRLYLLPFFVLLVLFSFTDQPRTSANLGPTVSEPAFEPYAQEIPGSELTIPMVPVKGGLFTMGSDEGPQNETPSHQVSVSDFWMGAYEISWDQYDLFSERRIDQIGEPPSDREVEIAVDAVAAATTPYVDMSHGMGRKGFPVVNVTQHAALTFCKWLSAKTGKFYRLPTEAEWEYACRAGSTTSYSFGDKMSSLNDHAWFKENSGEKYHKTGQKKPNALGLYDMHGNVAEWTMDQYDEGIYKNRKKEVPEDPWLRPTELYPRTVRGGSWKDQAEALRSAARQGSQASWKRIDPQIPKSRWWFTNAPHVGFRIVRPKITPSKEELENYWLEAIDDY